MRKELSLLLIGLLIFIPLPYGGAASTLKASITPITLGLGDSVEIANYTIQFYDVSTNWSLVTIQVLHPGGAQLFFLKEGETGYFPSRGSEVFDVTVQSIDRAEGTVTLLISSPLRTVRKDLEMTKNETVVLNSNVQIHLYDSWENGAKLGVKIPPYSGFITFTLRRFEGKSFTYPLSESLRYENYLRVSLVSASPSSAVLDVYMPALDADNLTLTTIPAGNSSVPVKLKQPKPYVPVYSGYLFTGESVSVTTGNGTYGVLLTGIENGSATIKLEKKSGNSTSLTLSPGSEPVQAEGFALMLSLGNIDSEHGRVFLNVYAPTGSSVRAPRRPANVNISISAIPTSLMLGEEVAVYINVENLGPGDARDLVVAAPIPSGFELVGNETGWSVGDLPAYSRVPALVYILRPTSPGEFKISGVMATYYNESGSRIQVTAGPETVRVYSLPELQMNVLASNSTYGGNWGTYVKTEKNRPVTLLFNISAGGDNPSFEFVKDAAIHVEYPAGVVGPALIGVGNISAGKNVQKAIQARVLSEGHFPIKVSLTYKDPLGNEHELDIGTAIVLDSTPPKVVVKEETVHVYPSEDQLPSFVNQSLQNSTNATALAQRLQGVISYYLPKESGPDYWKMASVILLILALILAYLAYGYYREVQIFRRALLRKRRSRPGGLPKRWKRDELEQLIRELRVEMIEKFERR